MKLKSLTPRRASELSLTRSLMIRVLVAMVVAAAVALFLVPAALAGSYPTYKVYSTSCTPYTASSIMTADYSILAADRYYTYGENQIVYVQAKLYSYSTGTTINTTPWIYGRAYDSTSPLAWFNYDSGAYLGDATFRLGFNRIPRGTYRLAVRFSWDASAWGAPAWGPSGWIWAPNFCTFSY
jgi:hypothetical protein